MTEIATVISGTKQAPPEPVNASASAVVRLNAITKKHRDSKWLEDSNFQQPISRAIGELCMEPNEHLIKSMMTLISISGDIVWCESSTELNSHANMMVIWQTSVCFQPQWPICKCTGIYCWGQGHTQGPNSVFSYSLWLPIIWTDISTRGAESSLRSIHGT